MKEFIKAHPLITLIGFVTLLFFIEDLVSIIFLHKIVTLTN